MKKLILVVLLSVFGFGVEIQTQRNRNLTMCEFGISPEHQKKIDNKRFAQLLQQEAFRFLGVFGTIRNNILNGNYPFSSEETAVYLETMRQKQSHFEWLIEITDDIIKKKKKHDALKEWVEIADSFLQNMSGMNDLYLLIKMENEGHSVTTFYWIYGDTVFNLIRGNIEKVNVCDLTGMYLDRVNAVEKKKGQK